DVDHSELRAVRDKPLPTAAKAGLFDLVWDGKSLREPEPDVVWAITEQDRALYCLCRPQRLLDLALLFTVFDGGVRQVARYQQFFATKRVSERVKHRDDVGRRLGGIIWHTQGSGKSLTMVMLA